VQINVLARTRRIQTDRLQTVVLLVVTVVVDCVSVGEAHPTQRFSPLRTWAGIMDAFGGGVVLLDLQYTHVGLLAYRLDAMQDAAVLTEQARVRREDLRALSKLASIARGEAATSQQRRHATAAPAPKAAKTTAADGPSSRSKAEDSSSSAASPETSAASSDCDVGLDDDASPGVDQSAASGVDQPAASAVDQPAACRFDSDTGRAFAADGTYLGRISGTRAGSPQEAVSLYCARHGCTVMRGSRRAPGHDELLAWFGRGQTIPRGKSDAHKRAHKGLLGS